MVLVERSGLPRGVCGEAATLAAVTLEVTLAERTLARVAAPRRGPGRPRMTPARLVADRGYDSRPLGARLEKRGVDPIVPHRARRRPDRKWQDGRKPRRSRHRRVIERTNAWLPSLRRRLARHERRVDLYLAFVHAACILITLRRF